MPKWCVCWASSLAQAPLTQSDYVYTREEALVIAQGLAAGNPTGEYWVQTEGEVDGDFLAIAPAPDEPGTIDIGWDRVTIIQPDGRHLTVRLTPEEAQRLDRDLAAASLRKETP